jgi:hypothetical protein
MIKLRQKMKINKAKVRDNKEKEVKEDGVGISGPTKGCREMVVQRNLLYFVKIQQPSYI